MLKKISCDKFLSNGKVRDPIIFHHGLNTVLGSSDAKNSIGKSTFLMIIDFVFGGSDYLSKDTKDTIDNVGHHTIKFEFEFNNETLYFSRSTDNPNFVNMCSSNYLIQRTITLDQFNKALAGRYGLIENDISLRDFIGRFFRIYHRETNSEKYPLRAATQENVNAGITALIKMFNLFGPIKNQDSLKNEASLKETTFKKARNFNQIKAAKNNTDFKENIKKIDQLTKELEVLTAESQKGLTELDSFQAQELSLLKNDLSKLRRQRTQLRSQLLSYKDDGTYVKKDLKYSYESLKEFFPDANFQELESVENFHSKLSTILKKELRQTSEDIQSMLTVIEDSIKSCETKITQISSVPTISKAVLQKYAYLSKSIHTLNETNNNYTELQRLANLSKEEKAKYESLMKSTISSIAYNLNHWMKELNDILYNGTKTSPTIEIPDSSHYNFYTPHDTGTGSLFRGLIIFDLVMLNKTKLPAIVHDTIVLKHIEDETLEKLIPLYNSTSKQVFIAFDRDTTYSESMQNILNATKVIKLSPGGNELFGRAWNEVKTEE